MTEPPQEEGLPWRLLAGQPSRESVRHERQRLRLREKRARPEEVGEVALPAGRGGFREYPAADSAANRIIELAPTNPRRVSRKVMAALGRGDAADPERNRLRIRVPWRRAVTRSSDS